MRFRHAARPVLLALMMALAWLIWGAATAQAGVPTPDAGPLLQNPASSALVQSVPLPPLPAPAPATGSAGNLAPVSATAVPAPAAGLADALTAAAAPVVSGVSGTVTALAPALPALPLVQAPLELPLVDLLPLPAILPDLLPAPLPVPLPGLPPLPTPAPGMAPVAEPDGPASAVASGPVAALEPVSESGSGVAVAAVVPDPIDAAAAAFDVRFGFTPARDLPGPGARPAAVPAPSGPFDAPTPQEPLRVSALPAHAGHGSSASAGGFGGAADISESWPELPATTGTTSPPTAEAPPASPSFDPGSSPD